MLPSKQYRDQNGWDRQAQLAWNYMISNVEEHRDSSGEINTTKLAEATAEEYNLYEDDVDYTILDWVFDLAVEAEEATDD